MKRKQDKTLLLSTTKFMRSRQTHEQLEQLKIARCPKTSDWIPTCRGIESVIRRALPSRIVARYNVIQDLRVFVQNSVDEANGGFSSSETLLVDAVEDRCKRGCAVACPFITSAFELIVD